MSKSRAFSRPRTKVYDSNYNIGESYYKSAIDKLDQKYGGRALGDLPVSNGDLFGMRPPPPSPMEAPQPRPTLREIEEEMFGEGAKRRPNSGLLGEYDAIFEGRMGGMRNGMAAERPQQPKARNLEEEIEEDLASSMKRLRAKATRSVAEEMEEAESSFAKKETRMKPRLDLGEKLMESVGLTGRARQALEEEGSARRRVLKMTQEAGEGEEMTKWTALKPPTARRGFFEEEEESANQIAAAARAKMSRARLDDLESEMQAMTDRSAAREKRVRDLKALVQDEVGATENVKTTIRMKSSVQSERKTLAY